MEYEHLVWVNIGWVNFKHDQTSRIDIDYLSTITVWMKDVPQIDILIYDLSLGL